MEEKLIFISHSSKDNWLVSPFVEKILNMGLEIPRDKIFYTSEKDTGIKSGQDFKKIILENLRGAKAVIQIITDNPGPCRCSIAALAVVVCCHQQP